MAKGANNDFYSFASMSFIHYTDWFLLKGYQMRYKIWLCMMIDVVLGEIYVIIHWTLIYSGGKSNEVGRAPVYSDAGLVNVHATERPVTGAGASDLVDKVSGPTGASLHCQSIASGPGVPSMATNKRTAYLLYTMSMAGAEIRNRRVILTSYSFQTSCHR